MDSRPHFVRHAAGNNGPQALVRVPSATTNGRYSRVVIERRLDIKCNPVERRQNGVQSIGIRPGCVKPNTESQGPDLANRGTEAPLHSWFTTGEYQPIQKPNTAPHKCHNVRPLNRSRRAGTQQVRIMTVATTPGTALAKHRRSQLTRPVTA